MKVAIEAATSVATWLTTLIMSVLVATNDICWYINSDVAHPLIVEADCSFPTLECIRKAKTYGLLLIKEREDKYWFNIHTEEAQANAIRHTKEARNESATNGFSKAWKHDTMASNPSVCSTVNIHQHNYFTNYIVNTGCIVAECTPPPSLSAGPSIPIQRLSIGDGIAHYDLTADGVFIAIMLFICSSIAHLCFSLSRCCWRCRKSKPRHRPVERVERIVTPEGLH